MLDKEEKKRYDVLDEGSNINPSRAQQSENNGTQVIPSRGLVLLPPASYL